jgi:DNA-binding NarL/FixJ family response regulator
MTSNDSSEEVFAPIKVIVADDHSIFRTGLVSTLKTIPFVSEIKEAVNGLEVMRLMENEEYDVVLLDIEMPKMNGIDAAKALKAKKSKARILILSMFLNEGYIMELYDIGVSGYLLKNTSHDELTKALRLVMEDTQYYCPEISTLLFKTLMDRSKHQQQEAEKETITEREREILIMLCMQHYSAEIADKLFITERTVKRHRQNLLEKTGAKNLAGLVIYALKKGVIKIDELPVQTYQ